MDRTLSLLITGEPAVPPFFFASRTKENFLPDLKQFVVPRQYNRCQITVQDI